MIKTIKISLILILIFTSIVFAVTLSTKQTSLDYYKNIKQQFNQNVESAILSITFTSDKECVITCNADECCDPAIEDCNMLKQYNPDEVISFKCNVCFDFVYDSSTYSECLTLIEGTSLDHDKSVVENYVKDKIKQMIQLENVSYIERVMTGEKIEINKVLKSIS